MRVSLGKPEKRPVGTHGNKWEDIINMNFRETM
jgi:hypothetical protein